MWIDLALGTDRDTPTQQPHHGHTWRVRHIISCHMADHVTDAQPCATQATSPAYLGLEGSNPCFPPSISTLPSLMPLPLHRTIVPVPSLIPNQRPHICSPVSHCHDSPHSLHSDSHHSPLAIQPCVPMSYKAQQLCVSLLYE